MALCSKCHLRPPRTSGAYCAVCHNEYQKAYYKSHPESTRKSAQARALRIQEVVRAAKTVPCADCHLSYPFYVMDFDHLSDKDFQISGAASRLKNLERVLAEIAKCEVVCANCHRERTFQRANG